MNLQKLRFKYEITQFELTVYLDMDQKTYHNIENGLIIRTRIDIYIKLALLYDVSIDYLLGITNIKGRFPSDMKEEVIKKYNIDLYLVRKLREKGTFQDLHTKTSKLKDKSTAPSP